MCVRPVRKFVSFVRPPPELQMSKFVGYHSKVEVTEGVNKPW